MKRFCSLLLALVMLYPGAALADNVSISILDPVSEAIEAVVSAAAETPKALGSAEVIATALSQLDMEEAKDGYTPYGKWYGYTRDAWCDMFVSWCARQAGLSKEAFPAFASCTTHMQYYRAERRFKPSLSRGGSYTPEQGDLIFFYNPNRYPKGNVSNHVGLVLCVSDGYVYTIEGNTHTIRLDYPYYPTVTGNMHTSLEGPDYVCVKRYRLNAPEINGYAIPDYKDRTPYAAEGFVDLGKTYEPLREVFNTLHRTGVMTATTEMTYSPRYGMARGEFLRLLLALYGLEGWDEATTPFADVGTDSPYYSAVMTARALGIVDTPEDNLFRPGIYIDGESAQAMISRTRGLLGLEERTFSFTPGDYSYMLTPYTIRADLAQALYALTEEMTLTEAEGLPVYVNGEAVSWTTRSADGVTYAPAAELDAALKALEALRQAEAEEEEEPEKYPEPDRDGAILIAKHGKSVSRTSGTKAETKAPEEEFSGEVLPVDWRLRKAEEEAAAAAPLSAAATGSDWVFSGVKETEAGAVPFFTWHGVEYVALDQTAAFSGVEVSRDGSSISLVLPEAEETNG